MTAAGFPEPSASPASPLGLADLIALNDELAALVRAGVPLEQTLADLGRDFPGRLGRATAELSGRIEQGSSLPDALKAMPGVFPPVYRAAVAAGLRAGRLPAVFEDLASSARRQAELRRTIAESACYPLFLVLLAYTLFLLLIVVGLPRFAGVFGKNLPWLVRMLIDWGKSAAVWGGLPPAALLVASILAWYRSSRWGSSFLDRLPVIGPMLQDFRWASFCENLALLVSHDVPLCEALSLAADGVLAGERAQRVHSFAAELRAGVRINPAHSAACAGVPRLLAWLLTVEQPQQSLVAALERLAANFRRRSLRRSDWLRYYLPIILTIVIGGSAALLFGLSLFMPLAELLERLAHDGIGAR